MKETELRFLINKNKFTELLSQFKIISCTKYDQVFFIEKPDKQLQIRSKDNKWQLRLKRGISNDTDVESEFDFSKNQLNNILQFCHNLGYNKLFVIRKERSQVIYDDISITLDHYLAPEIFVVELEICNNDNIDKMRNLASKLGIETYQIEDVLKLKKKLMKESRLKFNLTSTTDLQNLLNILS